MRYGDYRETLRHGTFDFPIAYYPANEHSPRYTMLQHWHPEYEIVHIRSGRLHLQVENERFSAEAGDTVIVTGGMLHSGTPDACEYECLVFDLEKLLQRSPGVGRAMHRILHGEDTLFIRMPRGIDELDGVLSCLFSAMAHRPEGFELTVQGCLLQLFGLIVREHLYAKTAPGAHRRLDRQLPLRDALRYMEEHYAAPVTLDELAAAAGMSRRYFCTFFRTMTGRTPMEHLNLYRIETAGELLLSTDRPVGEIAGLCGFDDASYFAKLFRRHMGCSPRRYRTVARGEKR